LNFLFGRVDGGGDSVDLFDVLFDGVPFFFVIVLLGVGRKIGKSGEPSNLLPAGLTMTVVWPCLEAKFARTEVGIYPLEDALGRLHSDAPNA
jgi:hypothetical protein